MERLFRVTLSRFHMSRPDLYVLQGYFEGNSIAGKRLRAFADGQELPMEITVKEGLAVRQKYIRQSSGAEGIDREYYLWITLPQKLTSCRCLKVYQYQDGEQHCVFRSWGRRLLREQKRPCGYLETYHEEGNQVFIGGWAVGNSPCRVHVTDIRDKKVPAEVTWHYRQDIAGDYPELETCADDLREALFGFEAAFQKPEGGKVRLTVCTDTQKVYFHLNLNKEPEKILGKNRSYFAKGVDYLKKNGMERTLRRCVEEVKKRCLGTEVNYDSWRKKQLPTKAELEAQSQNVFLNGPKISIVVPLYKTPSEYLEALVASVRNQTYGNWELCLSDGSGKDSPLTERLQELQQQEPRIKIVSSEQPLDISKNTNAAIGIASGEFIAFADHDDQLEIFALYECVKVLQEYPQTDLIYSDEDKISMDGKEHFQPHFKSDFNLDLLCSMNYFCHLVVVKRELMETAGLLNSEYNGAQDYDFVLRCVEKASEIRHIPKVLYNWRAHKDSTAENPESKRYAFEAGARAIQAHYDRMGIPASVQMGEYPGLYRTIYQYPEKPLISIIIPNKDHVEELEQCIQSILRKSSYPNIEFIIVENNSTKDQTFLYYQTIQMAYANVHVVFWKEEFNYSSINNFGAEHAAGEYLLFLNNDTELINPDALEELLGYCMREEVGAVGARLYYPDDTIQHAGVIIGFGGIAGHAFIGKHRLENGYFSRIICAADLSAVTAACMMVKRSAFESVGGFDPKLKVAFNDIDFCLRLREQGWLIVYNPYAELYHYESRSRGYEDTPEKIARFNREADEFLRRWSGILQNGDPYYNPNLTLERADFALKSVK